MKKTSQETSNQSRKSLKLGTETVANLTKDQLARVAGGRPSGGSMFSYCSCG